MVLFSSNNRRRGWDYNNRRSNSQRRYSNNDTGYLPLTDARSVTMTDRDNIEFPPKVTTRERPITTTDLTQSNTRRHRETTSPPGRTLSDED